MAPATLMLGPMGAGKTTAALRMVDAALASGRRVHILKHLKDRRYESREVAQEDVIVNAEVVTHDGIRRHAYALQDVREYFGHPLPGDVVWVEVAHFFRDIQDTISAW